MKDQKNKEDADGKKVIEMAQKNYLGEEEIYE
jgi:hypothetical protein